MIYKKVCVHHQSSMVRFVPLVGTTPFPAGTKHNKTIHPRNKSLRICLKDLLKIRPRQTSWTDLNRLWLPLRRAPCAASTVQSLPSGGPEGSQQLVFEIWELPEGEKNLHHLASVSKKFVEWLIYLHTYVTYMTYIIRLCDDDSAMFGDLAFTFRNWCMEHVFITCSVSLIGMAWDEQQRCTNFVRASWLEAIVFLKAALLPCRPGVVGPC